MAAVRLHAAAGAVVNMRHSDGSIVKALVSNSTVAENDPVALVAFHDVTEHLCSEGHLTGNQHWRDADGHAETR